MAESIVPEEQDVGKSKGTKRGVNKRTKGIGKEENAFETAEYKELKIIKEIIETVQEFLSKKKGELEALRGYNKIQKKKIEKQMRGAEEIRKLLYDFFYATEKSLAHRERIRKYVRKERRKVNKIIREERKETVTEIKGEEKATKEGEEGQNVEYNVDVNYS